MKYIDMIRQAPVKSEEEMWRSVASVSELVEKIKSKHPEVAHKWMMGEWCRLYGPHYNETLAREEVSEMYHTNGEGKRVSGELVSVEDAVTMIPEERQEELMWDAYVGANGFAHDLARSRLSMDAILDAASVFWFEDDDFEGSKVFWYYGSK